MPGTRNLTSLIIRKIQIEIVRYPFKSAIIAKIRRPTRPKDCQNLNSYTLLGVYVNCYSHLGKLCVSFL